MAAYVYRVGFESGPRPRPRSSRDTGGAANVVDGPAMRDASSCRVVSWWVGSQLRPWFLKSGTGVYVDDVDTVPLHANRCRKVAFIANRSICKHTIRLGFWVLRDWVACESVRVSQCCCHFLLGCGQVKKEKKKKKKKSNNTGG
jgi:hypothetical protein